jgi:uncharacterized damage-inducible protein DinB
METNLLYVGGIFKTNTDLFKKATDGVQPADWFATPGDNSNHLMWLAGHVIANRGAVIKTLGGAWSTPWGAVFARGAKAAPPDQYPAVDEIRSAWNEVSARLLTAVADARAELLASPAPKGPPSFDGKIGGLVAFLALHETYHVGQAAYLRKWLEYGQTIG